MSALFCYTVSRCEIFRRYSGAPLEAREALPGRGIFAMTWRVHCRRPAAGGKRGRDTKVSLPLLTPQPFLWTRLPSVARLKARGPQGRLVLQGHILDRSGAFRSRTLPLCTVWPRTVMRGELRKGNSGHNSVPKSTRRPESCSRNPRFAARPKGVAAQRKVRGVKRGQETILGVLSPFVSAARRRQFLSSVGTGNPRRRPPTISRRRRRQFSRELYKSSP